jgi:hypothetical protein
MNMELRDFSVQRRKTREEIFNANFPFAIWTVGKVLGYRGINCNEGSGFRIIKGKGI